MSRDLRISDSESSTNVDDLGWQRRHIVHDTCGRRKRNDRNSAVRGPTRIRSGHHRLIWGVAVFAHIDVVERVSWINVRSASIRGESRLFERWKTNSDGSLWMSVSHRDLRKLFKLSGLLNSTISELSMTQVDARIRSCEGHR